MIASTTKIMTALIVCEQCNVLDRMRIPKEAVGIEGSSIYLCEGEKLTLEELLYALMLESANDAAIAIAMNILKNGAPAVEAYRKFLSSGCSAPPVELLKIAGVDMSTPEPVNAALNLFGSLIDELDQLLTD